MLMSKQEVQQRRMIEQTLKYQAELILQVSAGALEAAEMLMACRDNETCSKLIMLSFNLSKSRETLDRMLADVRSALPTRHLTSAPVTRRM